MVVVCLPKAGSCVPHIWGLLACGFREFSMGSCPVRPPYWDIDQPWCEAPAVDCPKAAQYRSRSPNPQSSSSLVPRMSAGSLWAIRRGSPGFSRASISALRTTASHRNTARNRGLLSLGPQPGPPRCTAVGKALVSGWQGTVYSDQRLDIIGCECVIETCISPRGLEAV